MRTCKNCVFCGNQEEQDCCLLHGFCIHKPAMEICEDHQYPEKEIKQVLDEAVNLMDSFLVMVSASYEKRVKHVIVQYDQFFQSGEK